MPITKRRKFTSLTEREIRIFVYLILAVALSVPMYFMFSFGVWLNTTMGLPSWLTYYYGIIGIVALIVGLVSIYDNEIEKKKQEIEMKFRGMKIANIDLMNGIEFEQYLKRVLVNQGYSVSMTSVSGDLGVDLIASGSDDKIAIQAKRYNKKVSRRAISDAVAGMYHYGCNKAMVITNNYFSPGATELARSTGCVLVDRDTLAKWINDYQNTNTQSAQIAKEM